MRHRSVARDTAPPPDWVTESIALSHTLIDHGLRAGLDAMRHTAGLATDPWAGHDVLTLALYRALTSGLPRSATIGEVADRMTALVEQGEVTHGHASTLPASVQAAIASIGGPADLKLRTTLRRDDVHVWTSWLPVQRYYETTVQAPASVYLAMGGVIDVRYETREDAEAGHAAMCARVEAVIRPQAVRA